MNGLPLDALRALVSEIRHDVVVVKNPDIWGSLERGGDWDLVALDPELVAGRIRRALGTPESEIRRSYVWSLNYSWGHLDLLPRVEWRGLVLVSAERAFEGASEAAKDSLMVARPAHQVMAACVYAVLAHGGYKERYEALWAEAWTTDADELRRLLSKAFGTLDVGPTTTSGDLVSRRSELQRGLLATGVRHRPWDALRGLTRFAVAEARTRGVRQTST
jgi:hypothetical protein